MGGRCKSGNMVTQLSSRHRGRWSIFSEQRSSIASSPRNRNPHGGHGRGAASTGPSSRQRIADPYVPAQQPAALERFTEHAVGARWIAGRSVRNRRQPCPLPRRHKVTSIVASLGLRYRGGRAAQSRADCGGRAAQSRVDCGNGQARVWRRIHLPFNSYWRRAPRRARDWALSGGWGGGYDGANRSCRQEYQN
jgi:hypothetical protein